MTPGRDRPDVMDPPSQQLMETLQGLTLCAPRDLRRCRGQVRRLTRDLPAFDSVWIDALLQTGKLTPFQARLLENRQADRLSVGPCLLINQLGKGIDAETYLARPRDGRQRCVLKRIRRPPELMDHSLAALQTLADRLQGFAHPAVIGPHRCLEHNEEIVAISRYVPGLHLGELLVRRGRFPAWAVREMARQLIDGLAALEAADCVHGDVCLWNVRLTSTGVAVLVDAGIRPAVAPELTFHADLPPHRFDGIAPERIGTGIPPTSASDLYALGCLLWHLLAGRPPFPTGDPLAKLAAHQTRELADVREWAPDTPADLAEAIRSFTAQDPQSRPQTFREIRDQWGAPRRSTLRGMPGRRRLAKFRALFEADAPRIQSADRPGTSRRWSWVLALLLVLSGTAVTMLDQGTRSFVLQIPARWVKSTGFIDSNTDSGSSESATNDEGDNDDPADSLFPLPDPNTEGVIELTSPGPYAAADMSVVGPLTVRGTADRPSEIVITDRPLHIWAETLRLKNVFLRHADGRLAGVGATNGNETGSRGDLSAAGSGASPRSMPGPPSKTGVLLIAESQSLDVHGCRFQSEPVTEANTEKPDDGRETRTAGPVSTSYPSSLSAAVAWKGIDLVDPSGGGVRIRDTVFVGAGSAFLFHTPPRQIRTDNCLKLGPGALFTVAVNPQIDREMRIELSRVTLRQAAALLRLQLDHGPSNGGRITIVAHDCVWDLQGRRAALFQCVSDHRPDEAAPGFIEMTGAGSLANSGLIVGRWLHPTAGEAAPVGPAFSDVEGIAAGKFKFAGEITSQPGDSAVTAWQAPRRSSNPPGIDPAALPGAQR